MILASTKFNGYSLGSPLWWPNDPENISTGWLQGISLTLKGTPSAIYLTKYSRVEGDLRLIFSSDNELICSLHAKIGTRPTTYRLTPESNRFVDGYVTFYGPKYIEELDLSGTQVCPKYIIFMSEQSVAQKVFTLAQPTPDGKIALTTVPVNELTLEDSDSVSISATNTIGTYSLTESEELIDVVTEDTNTYTISGIRPNSSGLVQIDLPADWLMTKVGPSHIKIGAKGQQSSCPDADYINKKLSPGNFTRICPLEAYFTTVNGESVLDMEKIVCSKFNTEYENGGSGLDWNEFSSLHDAVPE